MQLCQLALSLVKGEVSTGMQLPGQVSTSEDTSAVGRLSIAGPTQQAAMIVPELHKETVARLDPAAVKAAFALKLRHEFDKIMATGGSSPAEAAAEALKALRLDNTV